MGRTGLIGDEVCMSVNLSGRQLDVRAQKSSSPAPWPGRWSPGEIVELFTAA
jgi:hypothetical protein